MSQIPERLRALRKAMTQHQISAYLVPSSDPHQSEYVAPRWETRAWLSGFDGSAGTLVVTHEEAGIWTDSRYFIQAEAQLAGTGVNLQKQRIPHAPEHVAWLAQHLKSGQRLGFDGRVVSLSQARLLKRKLTPKGIQLEASHDLAEMVWSDRPALPSSSIVRMLVLSCVDVVVASTCCRCSRRSCEGWQTGRPVGDGHRHAQAAGHGYR